MVGPICCTFLHVHYLHIIFRCVGSIEPDYPSKPTYGPGTRADYKLSPNLEFTGRVQMRSPLKTSLGLHGDGSDLHQVQDTVVGGPYQMIHVRFSHNFIHSFLLIQNAPWAGQNSLVIESPHFPLWMATKSHLHRHTHTHT